MLYAVQLVLYIHIYDVYMPANTMTFITELKKLFEFDFINPIKYHAWIHNKYFRISDLLMGSESILFDSEDQMYNIVDELQLYIMIVLFYIILISILLTLRHIICCSKSTRHFFRDKIWKINKRVMYNWTIRLVMVMYIQLCISSFNQMRLWVNASIY